MFQWIHPTGEGHLGVGERGIMALVNPDRLRRILTTMLSEDEFLGPMDFVRFQRFMTRTHMSFM